MKNRVGSLLGMQIEGIPWLGTFHSICETHASCGIGEIEKRFPILDTDDQNRLIKQLIPQ